MDVLACWLACLLSVGGAQYHQVDRFETDDCRVAIVEDPNGQLAVVKMIRSPDPEEQALLVIDACAAKIAETVGLPVNRVELLTEVCQRPATLHEFAPGESVDKSPPWEGFSLQQRVRVPGSRQWRRWGPLPDSEQGLSRQVIATMARHPDLARIAALDTFLGNADRSGPNLFYCAEADRFFGIDMAAAFRRPLAKIAIKQLTRLADEEYTLAEREALEAYRDTLLQLYEAISPELMRSWLDNLAARSGLVGICKRFDMAAENFRDNYQQVHQLVQFLS